MGLTTLKPRLGAINTSPLRPLTTNAVTPRPRGGAWMDTRRRIQLRDKSRCRSCGGLWIASRDVVDHIVERWEGGSDEDGNLQLLCRECNEVKTRESNRRRESGGEVDGSSNRQKFGSATPGGGGKVRNLSPLKPAAPSFAENPPQAKTYNHSKRGQP